VGGVYSGTTQLTMEADTGLNIIKESRMWTFIRQPRIEPFRYSIIAITHCTFIRFNSMFWGPYSWWISHRSLSLVNTAWYHYTTSAILFALDGNIEQYNLYIKSFSCSTKVNFFTHVVLLNYSFSLFSV
jgi:hypothetical protein